jgi:molybdopterin converting factor small subunit
MTQINIPSQLQSLTNGQTTIVTTRPVRDVGDAITNLEEQHPGIAERILDENGGIRRFVNIYVGDHDVKHDLGLQTPIPEHHDITILPAIAGG